ncbi:MAG TPA: tripartite tricarboxylate transporter substrate binding protein [Burkholderiales bacterium]
MTLRFARPVFVALTLLSGSAWAQSGYPNKPIHFIVPFPPGGGAESTARLIAVKLSEAVKQPVVVETRAGAGGNIGTEAVVNAAPDGYTILLNTNGSAIQPYLQKLTWDPIRDLAPVSLVATYSLVIAAHPSTPGNTLKEMVAYAKAHPGKLTYGSSGTGGPLHLGAEMFKKAAGVDILHVPYKGNAPATLAILGGEVNLTFDSLVGPLPNIRAGKLKALATTGVKRATMLPEVPTVTETGVAHFSYESWNGISVPAATPKDIVQRLNREIVRIVALPDTHDQLIKLGYEPVSTTTAQFAKRIAADYQSYGRVIHELGLKAGQ